MKKRSLFVITFLLMCVFMYAAPNYNNGNGTVLSEFENNEIKITVRKCELHVVIGDLLREEHRFIYDNYANGTIIGKLKDNDDVEVLESCTVVHLNKPKDTWGNPSGALWYKIRLHEITGWICITSTTIGSGTDPYYNNRYEIIGKIKSSGKVWTVRRMNQMVSVWEKLNVRDTPGLSGKKVFLLHDFTEETRNAQENHTITAMTEETETIDGLTDHWLQIEYAPNTYGWIFGGYVSVERGGPKYYIPEQMVMMDLSWF